MDTIRDCYSFGHIHILLCLLYLCKMKYSSVRRKHVGSNVKSGKTLVKRKPMFNPKSRVQRKVIVNPSPVKRKITSAPDKNMRLTKDVRWAVVDVETTGVGTGVNGRVVQIAIDVYEGRKKVDSFISYVNPRCKIPSGAYRVHKIGYSQVKNAPTLQQLEGKIKNKLRVMSRLLLVRMRLLI